MKITKKSGHYDTYSIEVTMGELTAIQKGLSLVPGPLADEGAKAISWYLKELPRPGQDPDEFKEKEKAEKEAKKAGSQDLGDLPPDLDAPPTFDADVDLPNPPGFDEPAK